MKFLVSSVIVVTFTVLSLDCLATTKETPVNIAIKTFEKYRRNVRKLSMECVSFVEDGPVHGASDMDITVREKHGGKCGGDQDTAPAVAQLRVKGAKVFILDPVDGNYKLLNSKYKSVD